MKYCNHCKKILNDTEKTYRDGICAECYHKYLLDKIGIENIIAVGYGTNSELV